MLHGLYRTGEVEILDVASDDAVSSGILSREILQGILKIAGFQVKGAVNSSFTYGYDSEQFSAEFYYLVE